MVESDKTPAATTASVHSWLRQSRNLVEKTAAQVVSFIRAAWGEETFSSEETSRENERSVVQYANVCQKKILLTADAGRGALAEAADDAPSVGLVLPGINRFQVPHHGARRNVSTEILDCWLGEKLSEKPEEGEETFTAMISASKEDEEHPRKAVIRGCIHRGARVVSTEGKIYGHIVMPPPATAGQLPPPFLIQKNKKRRRQQSGGASTQKSLPL